MKPTRDDSQLEGWYDAKTGKRLPEDWQRGINKLCRGRDYAPIGALDALARADAEYEANRKPGAPVIKPREFGGMYRDKIRR